MRCDDNHICKGYKSKILLLVLITVAAPETSANALRKTLALRALDVGIIASYVTVITVGVVHHEPWVDEAQAWLLARDLSFFKLTFSELRYEGSPGLWHWILWVATHVFHASYPVMPWIGGFFATVGVSVIVLLAPFPRYLRYLVTFSYFIVYQYAVVARNYVLLPLLAFLAAYFYSRARLHTYLFAVVLALLAHVSVHAMLIAGGLALTYAISVPWSDFDSATRRRHISAAIIGTISMLLVALVIWPALDSVGISDSRSMTVGQRFAVVFGALDGAFIDWLPGSLVIFFSIAIWFWRRRQTLRVLLCCIGPVTALYGLLYGKPHHQGTIFVGLLTALWISWPTGAECVSERKKVEFRLLSGGLFVLLAVQIYWAAAALNRDYYTAYSGALDAAKYLKSVGAEERRTWGYDFGTRAVLAYFDTNFIENQHTNGNAAYYHQSRNSPEDNPDLEEIAKGKPDYIIFPCWRPVDTTLEGGLLKFMERIGYSIAHISYGRTIWKNRAGIEQSYLIFRRKDLQ